MELFCIIYYACSYIQTIPQVIKLLKTKSSNDYSLYQLFLGFFGLICWSIYIFTSKQSFFVYIGTIIDLLLEILVIVLILRYFNFNKIKQINSKEDDTNEKTI